MSPDAPTSQRFDKLGEFRLELLIVVPVGQHTYLVPVDVSAVARSVIVEPLTAIFADVGQHVEIGSGFLHGDDT